MTTLILLILGALLGLPPCPTEDSTNCYRDAGRAGNGIGQSYIRIGEHTIRIN